MDFHPPRRHSAKNGMQFTAEDAIHIYECVQRLMGLTIGAKCEHIAVVNRREQLFAPCLSPLFTDIYRWVGVPEGVKIPCNEVRTIFRDINEHALSRHDDLKEARRDRVVHTDVPEVGHCPF